MSQIANRYYNIVIWMGQATGRWLSKISLLLLISINISSAEEKDTTTVMEFVLDTIENLTCQTQGIGGLLRAEFSHTCIPAPFFTFAVANIVSPGLYSSVMMRLNMNDDELFIGACDRGNRIEFNDQKLSFSLCQDLKLQTARFSSLKDIGPAMEKIAQEGTDDVWGAVTEAIKIKKEKSHMIYRDKVEGDKGTMFDITGMKFFPWKVIKEKDKMCVATQSFNGWIPVGCKYIKEPYPISIYADFLDVSPEGVEGVAKLTNLTSCANMGSCYKRAHENSHTAIVMSGPIIECVKEMVAKLTISNAVCSFEDVEHVLNSSTRQSSALFQFQRNMHLAVSALLSIYVILFGFRIILSGNIPPKNELVIFVIKFLFVVYFSVGINITPNSGNALDRMDGMIQWVLPFLLDGMTQLSSWIINATPSALCKFSDISYPDNLAHLQLWDALDCRVSHYLGLDAVQTMIVENATRQHDFSKLDILSFPIPPYIYLLVPAVISGNFTLISLAMMYPILVISVGAFVVNATVVCIISIVILSVLAPLFVPMYLFNYTRGYFDSWLKLLISFMLQPMVAIVFMGTMLSVYDFGFYGSCKYVAKDFTYSGANLNISIGPIGNSTVPDGRSARYFYVDQDWNNYDSQEEVDGCKNSLGFILNNPFQFLYDTGASLVQDTNMPWIEDTSGEVDKGRFEFLQAIQPAPGMFFDMVEVIYEKIRTLVISLLTACFTLYLMYHFSATLAEFAADMTEGVTTSGMGVGAQQIFNSSMSAISKAGSGVGAQIASKGGAKGAAAGAGKARAGLKTPAGDKAATNSRAADRVSAASASASQAGDKVATAAAEQGETGANNANKAAADSQPASSNNNAANNQSTNDPGNNTPNQNNDAGNNAANEGNNNAADAGNNITEEDNNNQPPQNNNTQQGNNEDQQDNLNNFGNNPNDEEDNNGN